MAVKLFVGSLPYSMTDEELSQLFADHGTVESAKIIMDRETNRSRGFGFVELSSQEEADAAIKALDKTEVDGRPIAVNIARPKTDRGGDRGGFNRGGGGGGSW